MRRKLYVFVLAALSIRTAPLLANPVTFFGQDVNTSGDPTTATPTNANAAHNSFFSNLTGTQTQTFESYSTGTGLPLTVSFGSAGNATLTDPSGGSSIASGNGGFGRFPISGSQYLETGAGSGFTITFSTPVSAFGFYGTDIGDFGGLFTLGLMGSNGSTSLTVPETAGSNGSTSGSVLYFGFYDTSNTYNSITFNNLGSGGVDVFGFDDFTIGSQAQVTPVNPGVTPEPSSLMLLGTGLSSLLGLRKLRRS